MTIPTPPAVLSRFVRRLPVRPPSWVFARVANHSIWPSLADGVDPDLLGVPICVEIIDWGVALHFRLTRAGFESSTEGMPRVRFAAKAEDLLRLALREEDPDTLFFNRRLCIEGDTDLGLRMKNLLDGIDLEMILKTLPSPVVSLMQRLARVPETH